MGLAETFFSIFEKQNNSKQIIQKQNKTNAINSLNKEFQDATNKIYNENKGFSNSSGTIQARRNVLQNDFANRLLKINNDIS